MAQTSSAVPGTAGPTREIADWVAAAREIDPDGDALGASLPAGLAGRHDSQVHRRIWSVSWSRRRWMTGPRAQMPLVGRSESLTPSWAVLVNGAASHALDYDDVNTNDARPPNCRGDVGSAAGRCARRPVHGRGSAGLRDRVRGLLPGGGDDG